MFLIVLDQDFLKISSYTLQKKIEMKEILVIKLEEQNNVQESQKIIINDNLPNTIKRKCVTYSTSIM